MNTRKKAFLPESMDNPLWGILYYCHPTTAAVPRNDEQLIATLKRHHADIGYNEYDADKLLENSKLKVINVNFFDSTNGDYKTITFNSPQNMTWAEIVRKIHYAVVHYMAGTDHLFLEGLEKINARPGQQTKGLHYRVLMGS